MVWKTPRQHGMQSCETEKRKRPGARKQVLHAPPFSAGSPALGARGWAAPELGQQQNGRGRTPVLSRGPAPTPPRHPSQPRCGHTAWAPWGEEAGRRLF